MVTVKSEIFKVWSDKEKMLGRRITIGEVAEATDVSRDAISGLLNGTTTRYDADVIGKVCKYFDVPEGDPVPFLVVRY